jgi:hypothetical protein
MDFPVSPPPEITQDIYEIGLMAAACPDFADLFVKALLAGGNPQTLPGQTGEPVAAT